MSHYDQHDIRRAKRRDLIELACETLTVFSIFAAFYTALLFVGVMQ